MKKGKIWKSLSVALSCMMLGGVGSSLVSCSEEEVTQVNTGDNISVWTTDGQEKVLQQSKAEIPQLEPLQIEMAKGEYEGAQVMMRANEEVKEYSVSVSRLTNGMAYIPTEQISVYAEKYMEITKRKGDNEDYGIGSMVPDALLPMATAIEYDENTIEKGNNQGVYVEVQTLADTAPGNYTGTVTINADGCVYTVPVCVTVWDFEIPQTPSTKNYLSRFGRDHYATFELDGTDYMDTVYFEKMLEYRMNSYLPFCGDGGIPKYIELLRKYYNWAGFSNYAMYYEVTSQVYKGKTVPFNVSLVKEYIKAIAEASLEDSINYLDKAMFYFCNIIDEPSTEEQFNNVMLVDQTYREMLADINTELLSELAGHKNYQYYLDTVSSTILNIPNVLPLNKADSVDQLESRDIQSITPCIEVEHLDSEEKRNAAFEGDGKEDWFYTCVYPLYPYPTTHIDDSLLGSRLMSWIQKKYGFDGYLNWAVNDYLSDNYGTPVDDPYTDSMRGDFTPGDGYLFYPGAKYGITGPVGSLRAVSYRDGMEDYEYFVLLDEIYAERGLSAESVSDSIFQQVLSEVIPTTDREVFYNQRREVANMITSCTSDFGVLYQDITIRQGKATVVFNTYNENATVSYKGETLQKEGGMYEITVDLMLETSISLEIGYEGETVVVDKYLSGLYRPMESFEGADTSMILTKRDTVKSINTDPDFVSEGVQSLKLDLYGKAGDAEYEPFFAIPTELVTDTTLRDVEAITFSIYNDSDEAIKFSFYTFIGSEFVLMGEYTAYPNQWNFWQVGVSSLANLDLIEGFYFYTDNVLDEEGAATYKTLYLDEIAVTVK